MAESQSWPIKYNKIKSILDMPCGDFSWMSELIQMNNNVLYTGYDIVKEIIDLNNTIYKLHTLYQK